MPFCVSVQKMFQHWKIFGAAFEFQTNVRQCDWLSFHGERQPKLNRSLSDKSRSKGFSRLFVLLILERPFSSLSMMKSLIMLQQKRHLA